MKHKVLITARHHACESMGNYVLEGLITAVLEDETNGMWLRENVAFLLISFMVVTIENTRAFGRDLASAILKYLQAQT